MMRWWLALLLIAAASTLYEEPPGGCQGPPDEFVPPPKVEYQPQLGGCGVPEDDDIPPPRHRLVPPAPLPPRVARTEEESAEELERQLYESEAADMMQLPEEDWDEFERQHKLELLLRLVVKVIAASATMGFIAYLLYANWQAKRASEAGSSSARATARSSQLQRYVPHVGIPHVERLMPHHFLASPPPAGGPKAS
ncbi:hypothetical protein AB1Y20_022609 [Prymnesium parvum]|uniref:Uncharacterized protein n=1 Tax=Prymnesium parvum TaxID=97485 RepID=A0AB34JGQ9_PRYPA